jgi:hypothetical protein
VTPNRLWILSGIALMIGSTWLLAGAILCRCSLPRWIGPLDVVTALAFIAAGGVLWTRGHARIDASARGIAHDALTAGVPVACLAFWTAADRVDWNVFLPGLAWRSFVILHTLPVALTLWSADRGAERASEP